METEEEGRLGRAFTSLRSLDLILKTWETIDQIQIFVEDNFSLCI